MIDWVTFMVPYKGESINGGRIVSIDTNGETEYTLDKYLDVEGTFSTKIRMKGYNGKLYISGNPSKFLQGHNLFGSDDLIPLVTAFYDELIKKMPIKMDFAYTRKFIENGFFDLNRIDINKSFSLDSSYDAKEWIRAAFIYMQQGRQKVTEDYGTIYIGKKSSRQTLKIYYKLDEFNKNHKGFVHSPDVHKALQSWANNKIRIEITLRKKLLKENIFCGKFIKLHSKLSKSTECKKKSLNYGYIWNSTLVNDIYNYVLHEKVNLPGDSNVLSQDYRFKLSKSVQRTYLLFMKGENPALFMSKSQFYVHRTKIKEQIGVDIKRPRIEVNNTLNNVIPLLRIIEAKPAAIPDWAYDYEGLLAINS